MKTILRIESVHDGNGMFNSIDYNLKALEELYIRHSKFASPDEDSKLKGINGNEFCAFKSVYQLHRWVKRDEIRILKECGFVVLMLDVEEFREGKQQILYKKEDVISQKDVTEMFI